jgi:DNA-binding protein HU-beta
MLAFPRSIVRISRYLVKRSQVSYNLFHMKKTELAEALAAACGLESKKKGVEVVDAIFDIITKAMVKGEDVKIPGFGNFKVAKRAERMGVNPKTGEKIKIKASIKPKFRAGKLLKEAVM